MDLLSFMIVVWFIKILAEDTFTTVKGRSNPRIDRRRARQKSRANNPIWNQFVGYLGDVAEDARHEQARRREEKRQRQEQARADAEVIEAQVVDDDVQDAEIVDDEPGPGHADLPADECDLDICPVHGKGRRPEPDNNNPDPSTGDAGDSEPEEKTMADDTTTGEIYGLDACIAYCEALAASFENHTAAGASGEQYTGMLTDSKVTGMALQSAHEMQEAVAVAVSAIETHKSEMEDQKAVQEAYDANSDAGDKEFQQAGR